MTISGTTVSADGTAIHGQFQVSQGAAVGTIDVTASKGMLGSNPVRFSVDPTPTIDLVSIDATDPSAVALTYSVSRQLTVDSADVLGVPGSQAATIGAGRIVGQFSQKQLQDLTTFFHVDAIYHGVPLRSADCSVFRSVKSQTPATVVNTQYYDPGASNQYPPGGAFDSLAHGLVETFGAVSYGCGVDPVAGSKTAQISFANATLDTRNNTADRNTTIGQWTELHSLQSPDGDTGGVTMDPWSGGETLPAQGSQFQSKQLILDAWLNPSRPVTGTGKISSLFIYVSDGQTMFEATRFISGVSVKLFE